MRSQVGLRKLPMNKASGRDVIAVELFQILKDDVVQVLHSICQQNWKTQQWPQDWKRSVFILIPKKGNSKECSHCCTIALISNANKEISPEYSLEGLMLKLKLKYFGQLMRRVDPLEKTLMLGGSGGRQGRLGAVTLVLSAHLHPLVSLVSRFILWSGATNAFPT